METFFGIPGLLQRRPRCLVGFPLLSVGRGARCFAPLVVGVLFVPIGWMNVMNILRLMRLRTGKFDNGRIVIGSDNNHYRFFLYLPPANPDSPTLSTLKGTLAMVRVK